MAVALLTIALIVAMALLAAVGAAILARLDGANRPAALRHAAATFAAFITLAAAVTTAIATVLP